MFVYLIFDWMGGGDIQSIMVSVWNDKGMTYAEAEKQARGMFNLEDLWRLDSTSVGTLPGHIIEKAMGGVLKQMKGL